MTVKPKVCESWGHTEEIPVDEAKAKRDYKDEYKKFQSSTKSKKYRAELNQYNRKKGTYGNGDGKDASHKRGKIVGFESQSKNRGRAEKSRLKKEAKLNENPAAIAAAQRMVVQAKTGKKVSVNTARQSSYAQKDPSTHKKAKSMWQRIKDKFSKKEGVNEGNPLEIGKLRDAILMFKKKIEKQGMVKNARDEDHLERLIKVYNKMGGKKIKEGTTTQFPSVKVDAAVKLAKRMGGNMTGAVKRIEKMAKGLSKNGRVQYALRKANEGLGDKMAKKIKKHKGTKVKKEGVNEGQKKDANNLAVEFGKSYQKFTVAVNGLAKSMTNITGDKTDEKIIMKAFKKHIIPFVRLVDSWNSGQQKNPNIDESVNEAKEPPVIVDLRDIVKKKQNKVMKDPVSGKKMRVDGYTANAIVKVYDAINTSNKKKFTSQPLMKMAKIAFKFVK